ncbi:hypothetical protein TRICI_000432 [Trichomonascus ciferrii]|uniref:Gfo/Idh/MocA-like oxidoreductase N-terminal domain-containing protein n=1 Tax=Trichomonascus ciferrii TaxID=44093 RepID=A0A642VDE5_9ASCO|nr:hypothetical protein TRICI_000432 [Trichomonascus ciferrii]
MSGIALIGGGLFIKNFHLPALLENEANIVAVYSRSTKSASSVVEEIEKHGSKQLASKVSVYSDEKKENLDELLKRDDVQGVLVALPILVQPDVVRKCLAAGKHVLCEKPIAKDFDEAKKLVEEYKSKYTNKGVIFSIAEQLRYDRASIKAREMVQSGKIGKLQAVHGRVWNAMTTDTDWYKTEWRQNAQFQGGFVLDAGVHAIATMRYVSNAEILETASFTSQTKEFLKPIDTVNAALKFSNDIYGTFSITFAAAKPWQEFVYSGSKGALTVVLEGFGTYHLTLEDGQGNVIDRATIEGKALYEENKAFLDAIQKGKNEKAASVEEAIADLAVIESFCSGGGRVKTL